MFEKYQETLYRHQSSHKTTLLLTSCLFSFPITWQMRLIWSVNAIQRLLVKQVVLSSWCIVQASVSNNILLSMFNASHHRVYRDLVLFPVPTCIQHKHGEQHRQQKNNITVRAALIKLKVAFCISSGKITGQGSQTQITWGHQPGGVVHGGQLDSCHKYKCFYNPKFYLCKDICTVIHLTNNWTTWTNHSQT